MVNILMNIPLAHNVVFDILTCFRINHMMIMETLFCMPLFYNIADSLSLPLCKSWVLVHLNSGHWFWRDITHSALHSTYLYYLENNEWNLKILNYHRCVVVWDLIFIDIYGVLYWCSIINTCIILISTFYDNMTHILNVMIVFRSHAKWFFW